MDLNNLERNVPKGEKKAKTPTLLQKNTTQGKRKSDYMIPFDYVTNSTPFCYKSKFDIEDLDYRLFKKRIVEERPVPYT